ncbi:MAG: hypothetical protein KGD73_02520 [Candidatus Lokiarchaeota archaeon]|nr:hypothetical protein [Candidatus Lokiarchaeota archaeon]
MSEVKLFSMFVESIQLNIDDFLVDELTEMQKEIIDEATFIFKENIIGDIKPFGGNIKKNEEKYNELLKLAEEELKLEKYKDIKKQLKDYLSKLPELIIKTCGAKIPVKELPWVDIIFRTVPRIVYDEKVKLLDKPIAYYGEIKCFIGRTTLYGKIKNQEPLFAPFTGNLDLGGYKLDSSVNIPKSEIFSYVNAIINSFDSAITKSQLAKYHEEFSRHGDPVCDFFMKEEELKESLSNLTSAYESGRTKSDTVVCGIAVPIPSDKTTLIITIDESEDSNRYSKCFEAQLKFSAASCNAPVPSMGSAPVQGQQTPGTVSTPGGQELKVWSAEELAEQAQSRMNAQPEMPIWTEEELAKQQSERGTGLPDGIEMWTEEELLDLAKQRSGGGLNIPEWEDQDLPECKNCGYALRSGWEKCPVCETPVGESAPEKEEENPEEPSEDSEE